MQYCCQLVRERKLDLGMKESTARRKKLSVKTKPSGYLTVSRNMIGLYTNSNVQQSEHRNDSVG